MPQTPSSGPLNALSWPKLAVVLLPILLTFPSTLFADEKTVLVEPGEESVLLPIGSRVVIGDLEPPLHGTLDTSLPGLRYEPNDDFWTVGQDVVQFHDTFSDTNMRFRIVAGRTARDGDIISLNDPGVGDWQPWQVIDPTGTSVHFVPGAYGPWAYRIDGAEDQATAGKVLGDPSGQANVNPNRVTSSEITALVDSPGGEDPWSHLNPGQGLTFFRISQPGSILAELDVWSPAPGKFLVQPTTGPDGEVGPAAELPLGRSNIRFERFLDRNGRYGGTLYIDGKLVSRLPMDPPQEGIAEDHALTLDGLPSGDHEVAFVFEDPELLGSINASDPTERQVFGYFPEADITGVSHMVGGWSQIVRPDVIEYSPQTLPGPGNQVDIDVTSLAVGESSFLESQAMALPFGGSLPLAPRGAGMRFWFDATATTLETSKQFTMASICGPSPPCGAVHVRLRQKAAGKDLLLSSLMEDGSTKYLWSPILGSGPQVVEVRMQNATAPGLADGWLELWLNSELVDRRTQLANHDQQPSTFRFGVMGVQTGSSGVLSLDDVEGWRFE